MLFHPKTRTYIHQGRTIPAQEVRDQLETFIDEQKAEVEQQSNKVLAGTLTIAAFFSWLADRIKHWHSISGVIAYGGQSQMNLERWKRINEKVQSELAFLDKWRVEAEQGLYRTRQLAAQAASLVEKDATIPAGLEVVVEREVQLALMTSAAERIPVVREAVSEALSDSVSTEIADAVAAKVAANTDDLIWGSLASRGKLYTDAAYSTYANNEKAREADAGVVGVAYICLDDEASCPDCPTYATPEGEYVSMQEVADVGSGQCGSRCRCYYVFELFGVEPLEIDRGIYA